jgi:hypothetical protein
MIRVAVTAEAFEAIAATLPFGSRRPHQPQLLYWLETRWLRKL